MSLSVAKRPGAKPAATKPVAAKPAAAKPTLPAGGERRAHPRLELVAQITVRHAKLTYIMSIRDLSRSGVQLEAAVGNTPRWVREGGQRVEIGIFLEDQDAVLELSGLIVRVIPGNETEATRFGVEFDSLSEGTTALLDKVLAQTARGAMLLAPPPLPPLPGDA